MKKILILALLCTLSVASLCPAASPPGSTSDLTCGPQSLLAICQDLGVYATIDELSKLSGLDQNKGTTMIGLTKAVEAKGLHAAGMKMSIDELTETGVPAIALLWQNHFVVAKSDAQGLQVTDYSAGPQVISPDVFRAKYSGFALLISKDESVFPKPQPNGPDLRFDGYDFNFGVIEEGKQAGHTFAYDNRGNEELVISGADTTCGCTQVFFSNERRVPPGGKGELVAAFDSTGRNGVQTQIIYVRSNDPITPVVQLQVSGVAKPVHLPVSVKSVDFGATKKHSGAAQEFAINDPGDGSLVVKGITSGSKYVKASVTQADGQYLVKVTLLPGAPMGAFKSMVKVSSNHPRDPVVEIPVTAEVVGDIDMFPHQFFLGLLKKGQIVSKTVTLSTTSDEPLKIEKIDNPCEYVIVKATPEVQGKSYNITATLKGTAPLGLTKQVVTVHTNNADQPKIEIPLYALIEE